MDVGILCWFFLLVTSSGCWANININSRCYKIMENADCSLLSSEEICSSLLQAAVCDKVQSCIETTWSKFSYDGHCDDEEYLVGLRLSIFKESKKELQDKQHKRWPHRTFIEACADEFADEEQFEKCIKHFRKLQLALIYLEETSSLDFKVICKLNCNPCTRLDDAFYKRDECGICLFAMNHSQLLSSITDTAEIEAMCSEAAPERVQECNSFVKRHAPDVKQLQSYNVTADKMCALMDACPIQTIIKGDECLSCYLTMNLFQLITKHVNNLQVTEECDSTCHSWHNTYLRWINIFKKLLTRRNRNMDLDEVCDGLTSCKGRSTSIVYTIKAEKKANDLLSSNKCEACLTALLLMNSNFHVELEKICWEKPDLFSFRCEMVRNLMDELINFNGTFTQPSICEHWHLCPVNKN